MAETPIGDDKLSMRLAFLVDAVREPVETVVHLAIPRHVVLPLHLDHRSQLVKSEVHPYGLDTARTADAAKQCVD